MQICIVNLFRHLLENVGPVLTLIVPSPPYPLLKGIFLTVKTKNKKNKPATVISKVNSNNFNF